MIDKKILKDLNIDDEYIVLGVSAGPDSMALLHFMMNNCDKKIVVCHINHNVRKNSILEYEYLRDYCLENKIIFESMKITDYNENNFENEARKKRYAFYEDILNKYHTKYLFLAHHGDDLIETVLMKIIRGSNIEGYTGIKGISNNHKYYIVRPFLEYQKSDLISYLDENKIKYFIDDTNDDINYTRNRIRGKILPLLKEEDNDIHLKFLRYSKVLNEYDMFVNRLVDQHINDIYDSKAKTLDIKKIDDIDDFLLKNIIFRILKDLYDNKADIIKEKHLDDIISLIKGNKPNARIVLPHKCDVVRAYNKLYFETGGLDREPYKVLLEDGLVINNFSFKIIDNYERSNNVIAIKKSLMPLYVRSRCDGDKIHILNGGTSKVKDIFIDKKIPYNERDHYPIVVDKDDHVIWIPNCKKSCFVSKIDESYDIIIKCYERKENYESK